MKQLLTITLFMTSVFGFAQSPEHDYINCKQCMDSMNVSPKMNLDNRYKILSELCELYNIELLDSASWFASNIRLKKDLYLPEDYYSFDVVLVPRIESKGCVVYDEPDRLTQIKIITENDSTLIDCDKYKPAYLFQSMLQVLPEKPHEYGEFYTRSTYMVIDYNTLFIIAKGEISNEGSTYFIDEDKLDLLDKFENSKQRIEKYR